MEIAVKKLFLLILLGCFFCYGSSIYGQQKTKKIDFSKVENYTPNEEIESSYQQMVDLGIMTEEEALQQYEQNTSSELDDLQFSGEKFKATVGRLGEDGEDDSGLSYDATEVDKLKNRSYNEESSISIGYIIGGVIVLLFAITTLRALFIKNS